MNPLPKPQHDIGRRAEIHDRRESCPQDRASVGLWKAAAELQMYVRVDEARQERGRTKVGNGAAGRQVELAWRAHPRDLAFRDLYDDRTAELSGNGIEPVGCAQERIRWLRV